jgi:hypothetical protein
MRAVILLALVLVFPLPAARATAPDNWVLVRFDVPASGQAEVVLQAEATWPGALVIGSHERIGSFAFGMLHFGPDAGTHVDALAAGVSRRVALADAPPAGPVAWTYTFRFRGFTPGDPVALLLDFPDAAMDGLQTSANDGTADLPIQVSQGGGAATVSLAEGAAATLNAPGTLAATAGGAVVGRDVGAGLVGSLALDCLVPCGSFWVSPDGRVGTLSQVPVGNTNQVSGLRGWTFAGPAGAWTWGALAGQRQPVLAAYAPVGDAWSLFAS